MSIPCTPLVHGPEAGGFQGMSRVSRGRRNADFASVLPLSTAKPLILPAKGPGFSRHAFGLANQRVRRGQGLGGPARPDSEGTRAGG